ncbi:MAG: transposase [Parachlamydiaceae bacterium]|nr:transposase [Parachlamydiaceae bacterium]
MILIDIFFSNFKKNRFKILYKNEDNLAIWFRCWAHICRKFFEADFGDSKFCKIILRKIRHLFTYERVAWNRSEEERLLIRQTKEAPIIDKMTAVLAERFLLGEKYLIS